LSPSRKAKSFPYGVALDLDRSSYVYIRAGDDHRFIPIWCAMVGERLMIRAWYCRADGWFDAFRTYKGGAIKLKKDSPEIAVRAKPVKSEKLLDAMDVAYREKYTSKANRKYVKGFSAAKRRARTIELTPR
jgi:hypothetical protein